MRHEPKLELLRSPPFPGVVAELATIDGGKASMTAAATATAREAARAMAASRVGGSFWGVQVAGRRRLIEIADEPPSGDLSDAVVISPQGRCPAARRRGALVVDGALVDPWPLIEAADEVISRSGLEIGILALAAGKPVIMVDGTALDDDGDALFAGALLGRCYRDPSTGEPTGIMEVIALLARWRLLIDVNRGLSVATGMAFWKRREVARLLWDGRNGRLPFIKPAAAIAMAQRDGGAVAAWPARVPADFADRAARAGVPVRWVEDGFLRSAGLGSDLLPPLSLIVDDLWPYFDPARPSRLEQILASDAFSESLLARAAMLRSTIVERRIGKYRIGGGNTAPDVPTDARLVVVIGQVEDDLSVLRGGAGMTNLSLIERARAAEPDAFIVYRPHPDVEAGHRRGRIVASVALRHVDRIDCGGSLDALLDRADTLHTITSLAGFEALLRNVRVVVHGGPFYAGWGLTEDCGPSLKRRTRRLTLDELVAGALIVYPRYLDPRHGLPCDPEQFIEGMGGVSVHAGWLVRLRRWQGRLRQLLD